MTTELDDEGVMRQIIGELDKKFADRPSREDEAAVREVFAALGDRPVRDYLLYAPNEQLKSANYTPEP